MEESKLTPEFKKELVALLNCHSIDTECETPDFILADHIVRCIAAYRDTHQATVLWHSPDPGPAPEEPHDA